MEENRNHNESRLEANNRQAKEQPPQAQAQQTRYEREQAQKRERAAQRIITGSEARQILRICGKSVKEFAIFIKRSTSWLRNNLFSSPKYVQLQYVRALRKFVSEEDYIAALMIIRKDHPILNHQADNNKPSRGRQ